MSTEAIAAPATRTRATLPDLVVRGVAWALVLVCLALIGTILVAGERTASYAELRAAVSSGAVDEVRVAGGLPDGRVQGSAGVTVHWRDGWRGGRVTTLTEATSRREAEGSGSGSPIIEGRVDPQLTALDPSVHVTRDPEPESYGEIGGWRVPSWVTTTLLAVWMATFLVLLATRSPWRATPWAWFWLLFTAPVGTLAFLLLGGPTGLRPPVRVTRRLTGGWAFLILVFGGTVVSAVAAALF